MKSIFESLSKKTFVQRIVYLSLSAKSSRQSYTIYGLATDE